MEISEINMDELVREQFRLDTNCSIECEDNYRIMINKCNVLDGARYFSDISPFFRAIIYSQDMYMMCDERILEWAQNEYDRFPPEWFCRFDNLRKLDTKLMDFDHCIMDTHIYFLPDPDAEEFDFECPYELKWYDREEIIKIKGNKFHNALLYCEDCPDEIAVAAIDSSGQPAALAGASSDGKNLWQIGVDVLDGYRQHGLAVYLVTLLKNRIFSMGKVPFYGTSESHSISRKVAVRAGFVPAWCEIYSTALDNRQINV